MTLRRGWVAGAEKSDSVTIRIHQPRVRRETLGLVFGFIGVVIFAATLPFSRLAVPDLGPWFITFGRAALAGLIALLVLRVLKRKLPTPGQLWRIGLAALCLVIGFPIFSSLAVKTIPSSHGGVVLGILPLATSLLSAAFYGERPSAGFWICGVLGAGVVAAFALRQGGGAVTPGDVYLLAAIAAAAIGYTISAKLSTVMPGWEVISWCVVLSLPLTIPASFITLPENLHTIAPSSWMAFAYLGIMSMYVGFFAWNTGLAMGGTARVSQVQLLQSFFTLAFASLINGETIGWETLLFAGLVLVIVFLGRLLRAR